MKGPFDYSLSSAGPGPRSGRPMKAVRASMKGPMTKVPALMIGLAAVAAAVLAAGSLPARRRLDACVRPELSSAPRLGDLDPSTQLRVDLSLPLRDPSGLDAFISALYDPHSPGFRRFIGPAEFAARFGPSRQDYRALVDFARNQGLEISLTTTSRLLLQLHGRAGDMQRAFHTTLGRRRRADGSEFFAPDSVPSVDLDLPGLGVEGLDNFGRRHPRSRPHPLGSPSGQAFPGARAFGWASPGRAPRDGSGSGGAFQGKDFRDAYLPDAPSSLQGAGQSIGLVEFSGFYAADITAYETSSSPPLPTTTVVDTVLVDGFDGNPNDNGDFGQFEGDCGEVSLDIEMALSMAPGATIVSYEASDGANTSDVVAVMAEDRRCNQISCSWSDFDSDTALAPLLAQLAAQGQGFFNASGDNGAYSQLNTTTAGPVGAPDDLSAYITEVGGTNLTASGPGGSPASISYSSESVWNDWQGSCTDFENGLGAGGASGGGFVDGTAAHPSFVPLPIWQAGLANGSNKASTIYRNIPDVSMLAENFWVAYYGGVTGPFDGTSGASPLWAAVEALANEQAAAESRGRLGFLNPELYQLYGSPASYAADFNDVTTGDNDITNTNLTYTASCEHALYYSAVTGYDLCTGIGTPKGMALINDLVGSLPSPTPTSTSTSSPTATPTRTATASSTVSPTLTVSATASPSATVTQSFTVSPTFSASPSATPSSTISHTFTVSPTDTVTPTASPTSTISPTFTASPSQTPAWAPSGLGRTILAPMPVTRGQPVCLYFAKAPVSSAWQVCNLAGEQVARETWFNRDAQCWDTSTVASGIYFARIRVMYDDGTAETLVRKIAVVR